MSFVYIHEILVPESPRTRQIRGMFDLGDAKSSRTEIQCAFPKDELANRPWSIGLILGPSGSGKSTMLRSLFGEPWQSPPRTDRAVVDEFPQELSIQNITALLSAVGFSSPPAWLRPRETLSNGQRFRAEMAMALAFAARDSSALLLDEFTTVVDRHAAKIGCVAFAKKIHQANIRLVAASCHDDILEWLQPDWVARPDLGTFLWRSLRPRPAIRLEFQRVEKSQWRRFQTHHYLSGSLHPSAVCFCLVHEDAGPVAFSAWLPFVGKGPLARREHRTVCLPDFQGVGLGGKISELCASLWRGLGYRALSTTSHPALVRSRNHHPHWRMLRAPSLVSNAADMGGKLRHATGRFTAGFEFKGPPMDRVLALKLLGT